MGRQVAVHGSHYGCREMEGASCCQRARRSNAINPCWQSCLTVSLALKAAAPNPKKKRYLWWPSTS